MDQQENNKNTNDHIYYQHDSISDGNEKSIEKMNYCKQTKAKFSFSLVCDILLYAVNLSKNIKTMQQKKTWFWLMVDDS